MYHDFSYENALAASLRGQWKLDDVFRQDQELDFTRNFLPDGLAATGRLHQFSEDERRTLNQICAFYYVYIFGLFEKAVVAIVKAHAGEQAPGVTDRSPALLNFADEEVKHIHLFERYERAFVRGFPVECKVVDSSAAMTQSMLQAHPLAAALFVMIVEWLTQSHYVDSIRDDSGIDPLFKSLFKHHWIEEAQHAKLDTLLVDELAAKATHADLQRAVASLWQIMGYMRASLGVQAGFKIEAFEAAIGRKVPDAKFLGGYLHRTSAWTFFGLGCIHPRVKATAQNISPRFAALLDKWVRQTFPEEVARVEAGSAKPGRRLASV